MRRPSAKDEDGDVVDRSGGVGNRRQLAASLKLTAWLRCRYRIALKNVIGHNESLSSPYHRELYKPWAHQTHADWNHRDMDVYRGKLRALLRSDARS